MKWIIDFCNQSGIRYQKYLICLTVLVVSSCMHSDRQHQLRLPSGFVSIREVAPDIQLDVRYFTSNNFIGRPINGYLHPDCILTREAANGLMKAQQLANKKGYSLKVYDCYRPQRAVQDFVKWAEDIPDNRMQHMYYPNVPKQKLFQLGYIADKSGHSRGSTMDLTLVVLGSRQPDIIPDPGDYDCRAPIATRYPDNSVDMGTGFDCFDELAHTDNPRIHGVARQNRMLLKSIMEQAGFVNYDMEWWHYTLRNEPYPDTYFDFPVN